jgi:arylsulfatase A-like enzyme
MEEITSFVEHAQPSRDDFKRQPFFSFSFLNHETHDYFTLSDSYDRNLRFLIDHLETHSYLNNTMFILMSDHGSRLSG